jgi:ABC-type branched-subunit amino acid transport system substrate-binding protein
VLRVGAAVLTAGLLAACQSSIGGGPRLAAPAAPAAPATSGEIIGIGSVRVALLLPRSAQGNGGTTALAFRNAAELAMRDFPDSGIQIAVYDTQGTPAGAHAAIGSAIGEGAQIVLGPLFASSVAAVAPNARQAGIPVVAFSSDASVAGAGVHLVSFLPSDDVRRVVSYSAEQGRRSFAALLPSNAYGSVVEAAFRETVANSGGRVVAIERYTADPADMAAKAKAVAAVSAQVDALFMPDGGDAVPALASALSAAGVTRAKVQYLGSGQWDDPRILNNPEFVGAWYPAPAKQGYDGFAAKYQALYGAVPPRNATLAYDATVLAAGLVRRFGPQAFSGAVLTDPNGFRGIDGVFRFLPNGTTERRLAVYEVTGSGARVVAPALGSFGGGS